MGHEECMGMIKKVHMNRYHLEDLGAEERIHIIWKI
jgi:hypothetical protein